MNGTIRQVNKEKGFGFIRVAGTRAKNEDYFFHKSQVKNAKFESLEEGMEVTFEDTDGPKGLRAEDVFILSQ